MDCQENQYSVRVESRELWSTLKASLLTDLCYLADLLMGETKWSVYSRWTETHGEIMNKTK